MKILYLLFPFLLLLVQGAAGSTLAPVNKKQCLREKGYCGFLKCSFPYVYSGKCSRFFYCCKKLCEGSPKPAKSKAVTVLGQHRGHDPGFAESA
ncbi:antimicrobial peptide THP1-like [Opisthocomus hoazin]|uniref:antimicrobial peptide THP1-like n=1 Tax=Opisthocomus hoazin TaxID=30419 RepID=UPI003F52F325